MNRRPDNRDLLEAGLREARSLAGALADQHVDLRRIRPQEAEGSILLERAAQAAAGMGRELEIAISRPDQPENQP